MGLLVAIVATGLRVVWGFSLGGPIANGGDNWQTVDIGYGLNGDINAPKNFGEGYRRNTPVMYYSYDATFLTYFGSNGVAAVDSAYAILNSLTNVDSYSPMLTEFPQYSEHANYLAQSLGLLDLKSIVLAIEMEQLGLADPVRYDWTLRLRNHTGNVACPAGMEYLVVQRNFDITPNSSQIYSPYVNGVLYSYEIYEGCKPPTPLALAEPFSTDPFALIYSPVASEALEEGYFYSGLTRDDVAGLRYLLSSNNIATETAAGGSVQLITNSAPPVLQTTSPFGDLLSALPTTPPATLQTEFPGLLINTSTNYFTNVVTTNITIYYTNSPGPSITNYQPFQLLTTLDLGLFNTQLATNSPATLLTLYPGLIILSSNAYYTNIPTPNVVTYFQPVNGSPAGTVKVVTVTNGYTPNYLLYYSYPPGSFANIYTNSYSSNSYETIQTVAVETPLGSPAGTLGLTNTTTTRILVHQPGGEFSIIPTNWCGFKTLQTLGSYPMISTSNTVAITNSVNGTLYVGTQTTMTGFTNHTYVIEPGTCEPTLAYATNYTTNIVVQYNTTLANVVTNFYTNNTTETIIITNIGACSNGMAGTLCTNVPPPRQVILTNVPSGEYFIPPATWCGYTILSTMQTTPTYTTNTVTAVIPAGINNIGQQYTVTTISVYTNHTFLVAPLNCVATPTTVSLREGIENIKFVRANYDSLITQFFQPITNNYTMVAVSNSQPVLQYLQRVVTQPDIRFSTEDLITLNNAGINIFLYNRSINFNQANILPGLAGPGTIDPPTTISFNRSLPVYDNITGLNTNAFLSELTQIPVFAWGSFDASTNNPIAYPDGTSIVNLQNQILIQITPPPPDLPDATNNVAYPATTFTTTGGGSFSPPFTWSLAPGSAPLPQGLSLSPAGTISGTPTNNPVGTYGIIIQLNDSLTPPRTVTWNYSINVPQ